MAEARGEPKGKVNAAIKVVVRFDDGETRTWAGTGSWGDGLAERYTASREGYRPEGKWLWEGDEAAQRAVATVRVDDNLTGETGIRPEAWAKAQEKLRAADEKKRGIPGPPPFATEITVYAKRLDKVTSDPDAEPDGHAPGHVDKEDAGDGSSDEFKEQKLGSGDKSGKLGKSGAEGGRQDGKAGGRDGGTGTGAPTEAEQREVSEFEGSIGIEPSVESAHGGSDTVGRGGTAGGNKPGGQGQLGGDSGGRTGDDTEIGGTGPGGDSARRDGDGAGSEDGGSGGTEGGSRDGKQGGSAGGMYGGEGKAGDAGVPSGIGLLGLISVPAALKGFVELALILSDADFTGFGKKAATETIEQLVKAGAKDLAETGVDAVEPFLRAALASQARVEAAKATKTATKKMATDKRTAAAWKRASKEEQAAFQRKIYYDHVDRFYREAEGAAKKARTEAEAILRKAPNNAAAQGRQRAAATMETAMEVKPVAGRLPQNHAYAGKAFPANKLPGKYRQKGLSFTKEGYPDFEPHAMQLPNGSKRVQIEYTGSRDADFTAANKAAKLDETPRDYTWHHLEDGKSMILVPTKLHKAVKHSGGVSRYKHKTGVGRYD
ncbi:MAG TPA: HNH endonuclease [Kofleriaceae bacterium]|nr:HNH endonuclease [Kofleriaceae bacterium]